ncbi:MAG: hypothetical protein EPN47_19880 [Acidobacteria bacterium]|nr:MAG: hypothetical protein EPN47_19880 [Acidobacteriota bacterium]
MGQEKSFFEKRTGEVVENKGPAPKTNRNEPENEAGKLLKAGSRGKNEPKTKLPILLKTLEGQKIKPKTNRGFPQG